MSHPFRTAAAETVAATFAEWGETARFQKPGAAAVDTVAISDTADVVSLADLFPTRFRQTGRSIALPREAVTARPDKGDLVIIGAQVFTIAEAALSADALGLMWVCRVGPPAQIGPITAALDLAMGGAQLVALCVVPSLGTATRTLEPATLSAAGVLPVAGGALPPPLAAATVIGLGAVAIAGHFAFGLLKLGDDQLLLGDALLVLGSGLGDATLAAAGEVTQGGHSAALAVTLGVASVSGLGRVDAFGAALDSLDPATASAVARVAISGYLAIGFLKLGNDQLVLGAEADLLVLGPKLEDATLLSTIGAQHIAVLDAVPGPATLSGIARLVVSGIGAAAALDAATVSGLGQVALRAALAVTLGAATVAATGTVGDGPVGALAVTLGPASVSGLGQVDIAGADATTLEAATLSGAGGVLNAGVLINGNAGDLVLGTGNPLVLGDKQLVMGRGLDDATVSATAQLVASAVLGATLEAATCSGLGTLPHTGSLAVTLADASVSSAVVVDVVGLVSVSLGASTLSALGKADIFGAETATLANVTVTGLAAVDITGHLLNGNVGFLMLGSDQLLLGDALLVLGRSLDDTAISATGTVRDVTASLPPPLQPYLHLLVR